MVRVRFMVRVGARVMVMVRFMVRVRVRVMVRVTVALVHAQGLGGQLDRRPP